MGHFKESFLHLGRVKANSKKEVIFEGVGELPGIRVMTASCSCTTPVRRGNNVKVSFRPGGFPKHLVGKSQYETMKNVIVHFKDGKQEVLSFKAVIVKK